MIKKSIQIVFVVFVSIMLSACFEDEKPKKVQKKQKSTNYIVKKVPLDTNKTLSKVIEDDGIVIDGSRDEQLLDSFGLAVSQVIVEDGVSVPDCTALAKTGYLTLKDCKEISDKYFGFYEIDMVTGEAKKVDDVFKSGIVGTEIDVRQSDVEFFDSSGNPLLNNLVEFEEVVDNSEDVSYLRKLSKKVPKENIKMKKMVEDRLKFIEDLDKSQKKQEKNFDTIPKKEVVLKPEDVDVVTVEKGTTNNTKSKEYVDAQSHLTTALSQITRLESKIKRVEANLEYEPNNENLIKQYDSLNLQLNNAQGEVSYYSSLLDSFNENNK